MNCSVRSPHVRHVLSFNPKAATRNGLFAPQEVRLPWPCRHLSRRGGPAVLTRVELKVQSLKLKSASGVLMPNDERLSRAVTLYTKGGGFFTLNALLNPNHESWAWLASAARSWPALQLYTLNFQLGSHGQEKSRFCLHGMWWRYAEMAGAVPLLRCLEYLAGIRSRPGYSCVKRGG